MAESDDAGRGAPGAPAAPALVAPAPAAPDPAAQAFVSVAQTTALAVQDAADHLRQVSTLSTTALGVALAQFLSTGDPRYLEAVTVAQGMVRRATEDFRTVGHAAADLLERFPASKPRPDRP